MLMFHVKHLLRRRPRLLGKWRPFYSDTAAQHFAHLGTVAAMARMGESGKQQDALADLGRLFKTTEAYANAILLEEVRHYCLVVQAYTRGDTDSLTVIHAEAAYYTAVREALGIED